MPLRSAGHLRPKPTAKYFTTRSTSSMKIKGYVQCFLKISHLRHQRFRWRLSIFLFRLIASVGEEVVFVINLEIGNNKCFNPHCFWRGVAGELVFLTLSETHTRRDRLPDTPSIRFGGDESAADVVFSLLDSGIP